MKRNESGFTLVELVVVITILGILAAFAVPRFFSLETEARIATVEGLAGSLRSAAALSHGLWLAQGSPATITVEGEVITMANGYPDLATIELTLADTTGFNYDATTGVYSKVGAPTPATCSVTYTEAPANGVPDVAVVRDGC